MSGLICIQTVCHSEGIPERIFRKKQKLILRQKSMQNYPACKELNKKHEHIIYFFNDILSDFINLTQMHNFTVSAQDIFRRLSVFTVSFTGILQLLMQIMKRFISSY